MLIKLPQILKMEEDRDRSGRTFLNEAIEKRTQQTPQIRLGGRAGTLYGKPSPPQHTAPPPQLKAVRHSTPQHGINE